tara:strand:- start:282 stop:452 length:171 start_codon:yes stop_codon:yes gene_type:complete
MVVVLVVEVLIYKTPLASQFGVEEEEAILGTAPVQPAMGENLSMEVLVAEVAVVIT